MPLCVRTDLERAPLIDNFVARGWSVISSHADVKAATEKHPGQSAAQVNARRALQGPTPRPLHESYDRVDTPSEFDSEAGGPNSTNGGKSWHLWWASVLAVRAAFQSSDTTHVRLGPRQVVCHFPSHAELTKKDLMAKHIQRYADSRVAGVSVPACSSPAHYSHLNTSMIGSSGTASHVTTTAARDSGSTTSGAIGGPMHYGKVSGSSAKRSSKASPTGNLPLHTSSNAVDATSSNTHAGGRKSSRRAGHNDAPSSIPRGPPRNADGESIAAFVPQTFALPNDASIFVEAFKASPSPATWILKPAGSSQGRGIKIVSHLKDVPNALLARSRRTATRVAGPGTTGGGFQPGHVQVPHTSRAVNAAAIAMANGLTPGAAAALTARAYREETKSIGGGGLRSNAVPPIGGRGVSDDSSPYFSSGSVPAQEVHVISRYIDRPLLIGGRKFDLRIYVLVPCFKPLRAFRHRAAFARFCTEKYPEPEPLVRTDTDGQQSSILSQGMRDNSTSVKRRSHSQHDASPARSHSGYGNVNGARKTERQSQRRRDGSSTARDAVSVGSDEQPATARTRRSTTTTAATTTSRHTGHAKEQHNKNVSRSSVQQHSGGARGAHEHRGRDRTRHPPLPPRDAGVSACPSLPPVPRATTATSSARPSSAPPLRTPDAGTPLHSRGASRGHHTSRGGPKATPAKAGATVPGDFESKTFAPSTSPDGLTALAQLRAEAAAAVAAEEALIAAGSTVPKMTPRGHSARPGRPVLAPVAHPRRSPSLSADGPASLEVGGNLPPETKHIQISSSADSNGHAAAHDGTATDSGRVVGSVCDRSESLSPQAPPQPQAQHPPRSPLLRQRNAALSGASPMLQATNAAEVDASAFNGQTLIDTSAAPQAIVIQSSPGDVADSPQVTSANANANDTSTHNDAGAHTRAHTIDESSAAPLSASQPNVDATPTCSEQQREIERAKETYTPPPYQDYNEMKAATAAARKADHDHQSDDDASTGCRPVSSCSDATAHSHNGRGGGGGAAKHSIAAHLTNVSLQKHLDGYNAQHGGKWSFDNLLLYLTGTRGEAAATKLLGDIDFVIEHSLRAVQPSMRNDPHCFELYGYDLLLDSELRPWLIEVNASPSLAPTTEADERMKAQVISDTLSVIFPEGKPVKHAHTRLAPLPESVAGRFYVVCDDTV